MSHKIAVLDGYTMNPGDLNWDSIKALGPLDIYDRSKPEEVVARAKDAAIVLTNKVVLDEKVIDQLPNLQFICVTATGYNNVDLAAAKRRGIPVSNVVGYSTDSVAQHVFALLLALTSRTELHSNSVNRGDWSNQPDFCYWLSPITELSGKVFGIYGFGRIGQAVGTIAQAFGMQVLAKHKHPERDARPGVRFVELPELFAQSDVVSLHAPLTDQNAGMVNYELLSTMKKTAYLINTGRGGLINEPDLREALLNGQLAGAGLDVLSSEPPPADHPLYGIDNCIITPHIAWASRESRQRLMDATVGNIEAFLQGAPRNVVNG